MGEFAILNTDKVVREGPTEKMMFEQRLDWHEEARHMSIKAGGDYYRQRNRKGPVMRVCLAFLTISREANVSRLKQ